MSAPSSEAPGEVGELWYGEGLAFACQGCGGCCTGAPGYVWVTPEEIAALAERLGMDEEAFRTANTHEHRGRLTLNERSDNFDCILLDEKTRRCEVYDIRPLQCRAWPWWRENLRSPEAWQRAGIDCSGIGSGPVHGANSIRNISENEQQTNGGG